MSKTQTISIISFEQKHTKVFADLNIAWLEKYFVVEPHDIELLEKCEETIINKGGFIFFAKINDVIAGTFSLIKISEGTYELGKMAVSPEFQGHKIGQQLLAFCLDFARNQHWHRIILYSNRILENAIYIYKKQGFKEIELEQNSPYNRSNIKMEYLL